MSFRLAAAPTLPAVSKRLATKTRTVISLDLGRLDRVLEIDEHSQLARIQAGALGPNLEAQLQARGFTLGHFPDSFNHSTLGGWIATQVHRHAVR